MLFLYALALTPRLRSPFTISRVDKLARTTPFVSFASDCSSWNKSTMKNTKHTKTMNEV